MVVVDQNASDRPLAWARPRIFALRIAHLSDIHIWRFDLNPFRLLNKRAWGMMSLAAGRARRFRLERLDDVVDRVLSIKPDHILITGDLTTTSSPAEFAGALKGLARLLVDSDRTTIIPGNHDRYTASSARSMSFECAFGAFAPAGGYPWLRRLDRETAILGLDPTQPRITARGYLPPEQLNKACELIADPAERPRRLIVACHYPVAAPPGYLYELSLKRIENFETVRERLATIGPHLYCCGHVHAAWAFRPPGLVDQLCLNAGSPLLRDRTGLRPPGFLEITLEGSAVTATHHAWFGRGWRTIPLHHDPCFFPAASEIQSHAS